MDFILPDFPNSQIPFGESCSYHRFRAVEFERLTKTTNITSMTHTDYNSNRNNILHWLCFPIEYFSLDTLFVF